MSHTKWEISAFALTCRADFWLCITYNVDKYENISLDVVLGGNIF